MIQMKLSLTCYVDTFLCFCPVYVFDFRLLCLGEYRDLLIVLPMREPSIFRGIAVSLLRPVIGSNVEIDVVALNWVADVRKQIAKYEQHSQFL